MTAHGNEVQFAQEELLDVSSRVPGWAYDPAAQTLERTTGKDIGFWLDVDSTELTAKEPTEAQLELMLELAQSLGARVRGDDFETYRPPTETYNHPDDDALRKDAAPLVKPTLSRHARIVRYLKIGLLVLLVLNFIVYVVRSLSSAACPVHVERRV